MTTLNLQVNASGNDGSIDNIDLSPQLTANLLNVGDVNNSSSTAGLRFTNVTIPQGATISSATLTLYGYSSYSTGSTISAIAACEDADNSAAFAASPDNFNTTNRPRTTAKSSAVNIASVTAGSAYTWNVATSVQEVINRTGWTSGNAISIFVDNNASSSSEWQEFEAYDHSTSLAAKLDIVYTTGGGTQNITHNLFANTSTIHSPSVSPGVFNIAPSLLTNTSTIHSPVVSSGVPPIVPNLLTNTSTFHTPTITTGSVNVSANVLTNSSTLYSLSLIQIVAPPLLDSTAVIHPPTLPTATSNWNVQVGDGYSDVSPKQLVRTKSNYLYTIAPNCDVYPDFSSNGLTQSIRVHKSNGVGVPSGFTRKNSAGEPTAVTGSAAAIDSSDNIHIAWVARSSSSLARYLRYSVFDTSTDTWGTHTTISSLLDFDDIGQGDQSVSIAIDASDKAHIVFLSTNGTGTLSDRRIYYTNNVSGSWSTPLRLDSDVTYTGNQKAWHPNIAFDSSGNIITLWEKGDFNDGQNGVIYSKFYNGSWGSSVQASAGGDNILVGIDQSTSLLVTPNGTIHTTYMLYSATNSQKYIRYRYSTDSGSTWSGNNPTNQATHNPSLGWTGSKVRILGHGTPDGSNHGENLYYFEGDGGSASWGSWTQFVTGTNYDSSVNTRWSQFNHNYPSTFDIIYWDDAYPNVLYAGSQIFSLDVAPSALTNTNTFYDATLSSTTSIAPDLLTNTTVFYDATLTTGTIDIVPDVLTNSNTVYAPTILINVDANLLINSNTIHTPTVDVGAVTITTDLLTNTSVIFSPVVGGSIAVDNLVNSQVFYDPTISTGAVTIAVDALTNTSTIFTPTVNAGAATITPDLLSNSTIFYGPTINVGATNVLMDSLNNSNVIYSPIVSSGEITIVPELLTSSSVIYSPTVSTGAVNVDVNLLSNSNTVYEPTVTTGAVNIDVDVLTNTSVLFTPVVSSGGITIVPDILESSNTFYGIIVSAGAVDITTDLLENTNQVFAPDVVQSVVPDFLVNTNQVFQPSLVQLVSTQILNNTNGFYSPAITTGAVNIETDRVESTTQIFTPQIFVGVDATLMANLLTNTSVFYSPTLVDRYGRINRVSATSRTNELSSTTREYDILVN